MDHSEEYYKMKYFKYKAKYTKEKQAQQSGGVKSKGAAKKNGSFGLGNMIGAVGKSIVAGASAVGSGIKAVASSINHKNTDKQEVINAIKDLNDIYQYIKEPDETNDGFIEYLKKVKTDTSITDLKNNLNNKFFSDAKMKKYTTKEEITAKTKLKNDSYEKLDKQCTPYIGKKIQESCTKIFKSENLNQKIS